MKREIEQSLEEHHSMEKQREQQEQQEHLEHLEQVSPVSLPSKILLCPLESGVR